MKRILTLMLVVVLLTPIIALASQPDIKSMSDADLLALYNDVASVLRERGKYPYVELKNGASGDQVSHLQRRLKELGYFEKDPTGKFDANTTNALKAFEKASDLKRDGIASVTDQELLFSAKAVAKPTPTPKPTQKPKPTPKPTPTPDPRKAYGKFDYNQAARYPSEYKGTKVKISGRVVQVLGDRKEGFEMRLATKGRYDNIVYVYTMGNHPANILEGDKINCYCVMQGDYTYKTVMGQSVTLPLAKADSYD